MIIYLCIKYESNTLIFSKDIKRKPFFVPMDGTYIRTAVIQYASPIENGGSIKKQELLADSIARLELG